MTSARYVDIKARMNAANGAAAGVITLLLLASTWGRWRAFVCILVTQLAVIAFNTLLVNPVLLPRMGLRAEFLRVSVNVASGIAMNHVAGWPLAGWLLLPYVALAFDHVEALVAISVVVVTCATQDAVAVAEGVRWTAPATFTALAVLYSLLSHRQHAAMRAMLAETGDALARLRAETAARERAEHDLRQAHKLEAVGRLAAGVAHEINTPLQFVSDSVGFANEALVTCVAELDALLAPEARARLDFDFMKESAPEAIRLATTGLERIGGIVASMKAVANPERATMTSLDVNDAVQAALTVARHEWRYVAEIETRLGELPPISCHAGEIHQVFVSLIVNAAQAIAERGGPRGTIRIESESDGESVLVKIADDGPGIPERARERVFEPFFTTKAVGKGTGQGLAIARNIVVDRHGGEIRFETELGRGTTFFVKLPLRPRTLRSAA